MRLPFRLREGYQAFRSTRLRVEQTRYRDLAERGQSPEIMVIGCCDSRVSPEVIFDARPGELFVVRNIANLVPPHSPTVGYHGVSAAVEFALVELKVKHIVVLGHAQCGGVRAFADNAGAPPSGDFISNWMSLMAPAAATVGPRAGRPHAEHLEQLEKASIGNSLANLLTFPQLRTLVEQGHLTLHGAYFGVATGKLEALDPATGKFEPV
jgi:carbonic anhydrase